MGLAGQGGEGGCYLWYACADVGGHGPASPAVVFVPGIGLGHGETEVALDPGQDRVSYPMHADLLGRHPGEVLAEPPPEIVVTPGGDRLAVGVAQQTLAGI